MVFLTQDQRDCDEKSHLFVGNASLVMNLVAQFIRFIIRFMFLMVIYERIAIMYIIISERGKRIERIYYERNHENPNEELNNDPNFKVE